MDKGNGSEDFSNSAGRQQEEQGQAVHHYYLDATNGTIQVTTSEHAAQRIALLERDNERMRKEMERKDSTIFNLRFRSYLESLGEAERQAVNASAGSRTTGLLKAFFEKALTKAIGNPSHPLHAIQNHYRQASDRTGKPSSQVKQKADDLFPHFSRNIHKYFEAQDEFEIPRNLDMHDALLAELLMALKPTSVRDAGGKVDAVTEYARFI